MKKILLIVLSLLLIVGCSKPVEDSTLIKKDGLIYSPDSDKPYTGEVFTNYDTGEREYQGTYEKGLLVSYSFLNKDGGLKKPVNQETLIDRNGFMFEVNGQKPYTGDVFRLFDNGNKKSVGIFKKGKKQGVYTTYHKNGQKRTEGTYINGKKHGLQTTFYKNGQQKYEAQFVNGKKKDWKEWNKHNRLIAKITYQNYLIDCNSSFMQSQILINKLNTDLELYARNSYIKNGRRSWPKNPFDAFTDEVTQDDGYGFDTLYTDFPNCLSTPMTNQKGMFWSFTNGNINFRNDDSIFVFKYDQNYYGEITLITKKSHRAESNR